MEQDRTLGGVLRVLRTNAQLSQRQLAERIGITDSAIAQFEQGRRYPGDNTITRIAEALGLTKRQTDRLRAMKGVESSPPPVVTQQVRRRGRDAAPTPTGPAAATLALLVAELHEATTEIRGALEEMRESQREIADFQREIADFQQALHATLTKRSATNAPRR